MWTVFSYKKFFRGHHVKQWKWSLIWIRDLMIIEDATVMEPLPEELLTGSGIHPRERSILQSIKPKGLNLLNSLTSHMKLQGVELPWWFFVLLKSSMFSLLLLVLSFRSSKVHSVTLYVNFHFIFWFYKGLWLKNVPEFKKILWNLKCEDLGTFELD